MLSTCPRLGIQVCQRSLLANYIFTFLLKSEMYPGRYSKGKFYEFLRENLRVTSSPCLTTIEFPESIQKVQCRYAMILCY